MSIGLRPYLSPRMPQIGLAIAIERPETLAVAAVHRSSSAPLGTPRSWWMKIERNGKAKLKPKIAMNSANHSATRFRRQSIPPGPRGGTTVACGLVAKQLDYAVGCDRQPVDDGLRVAFAQRVFDGIGDRGGNRDRAAFAGALETLGVGVRRCFQANQLRQDADLAAADD